MKWVRWFLLLMLFLGIRMGGVAGQGEETQVYQQYLDACLDNGTLSSAHISYTATIPPQQELGLWLNDNQVYPLSMIDVFEFAPDCSRAAVSFEEGDIQILEIADLDSISTLLPTGDIGQGGVVWIDERHLCTLGIYDLHCWDSYTGGSYSNWEHQLSGLQIKASDYAQGWFFSVIVREVVENEKKVSAILALDISTGTSLYKEISNFERPQDISVTALEDGDIHIATVDAHGEVVAFHLRVDALEMHEEHRENFPELLSEDLTFPSLRWIDSNYLGIASTFIVLDGVQVILLPSAVGFYAEIEVHQRFEDET